MKKKAYVIGTNVNKSLSPTIFQYWFKKYNIDGEYGYIEIEEKRFDKEIFSLLNTRSDLVGLNITIPYKEKIIPHLKEILTPHPKNIGSINFIWSVKKNIWFGDNSDFIGFEKPIKRNQKKLEREKAIVIGFGGASKAVIYSLILMGFKEVYVFNRSFEKLIKSFDDWRKKMYLPVGSCNIKFHQLEDLKKHTKDADLIVNTTPTNVLGESKTWGINSQTLGFDIVYKPRQGTGFLKHFNPNKRIEGIQMLIYQAIPCFHKWFGVEPEADNDLFDLLYKKLEEKK